MTIHGQLIVKKRRRRKSEHWRCCTSRIIIARHILISSFSRFTSSFQVISLYHTCLIYLVTIIFRGEYKWKISALCSCLSSLSITYIHCARCFVVILNEKPTGLVKLENMGCVWRILVWRLEEKRFLGRPSVEGKIILKYMGLVGLRIGKIRGLLWVYHIEFFFPHICYDFLD